VSLREFFRGPLTHQELINLVVHLPAGCALDRAQRGEAADWRMTDYLLAQLINDARQAAAGKELPPRKLIQPPGTKPAASEVGGAKELDALFTGGG
jgi:hypothetical protein